MTDRLLKHGQNGTSSRKIDQLLSRYINHNNTPIDQRFFGKGHYLHPQLIQLYDCKNIFVEGLKTEDSPFWCLHLLRCENITVRNIKYEATIKQRWY